VFLSEKVYKIRKKATDTASSGQTYIIPANKNVINYFDTQIKPAISYSYEIIECALVLGSKVDTMGPITANLDGSTSFNIEMSPVLYLLEIPIARDTAMAYSDPGTPPNIDFYTKNNFDNKVYMRLYTSGISQIVDNYHEILESDLENTEMLKAKNRYFDKYIFQNRHNDIQYYEVMRLSARPKELKDFAEGKLYVIDESLIYGNVTVSSTLKTNKKYYYLCRSVNQHGLTSNHSVIYEVELFSGSSTSRIEVSTYTLKPSMEDYQSRSMSKLIQILPSSRHTIYAVNEGELPTEGEASYKRYMKQASLGEAEYPIWGEKFKIRVTSNNTGRKIDFNLDFNLIKKKTIEEIK